MCNIVDLEKLLDDFEVRKNKFNIFKVLKMSRGSENRHSNMLSWFFDPDGNHGLGNLVLKKFLWQFDILIGNNINIEIIREPKTGADIPDIVITGDVNCVIEVKYGAGETNRQCVRYYENRKYKGYKFFYLTLDEKSYLKVKDNYDNSGEEFNFSEVYKFATFDKNVIPVIRNCLNEVNNEDIKKIIEQYLWLLEEKYFMYEGEYIKDKVITCQKGKIFNEYLKDINPKYHEFMKNGCFEEKRYKIMWILFRILKDNNILGKEYNNFNSLSVECKYKEKNILFTNARTKNNSEISVKGENKLLEELFMEKDDNYKKNKLLFNDTDYDEKLFYVYDESVIKKNLEERLESYGIIPSSE